LRETVSVTARGERLTSLDVLRGVAVLGILLVNIVGMGRVVDAAGYYGHDGGPAGGWNRYDQVAWWFSQLVVEGTMRGLFTLLFGAGFLLFCARDATADGRSDIGTLYLRRVGWLVAFGIAHALLLLWVGDILIIYGLVGPALYLFRDAPPRRLIAVAGVLLAALTVWSTHGAWEDRTLARPAEAARQEAAAGAVLDEAQAAVVEDWNERLAGAGLDEQRWAEEIEARRGGFAVNFRFAWNLFHSWLLDWSTVWWMLDALAFMLIGAALLRLDVITGRRSAAFYGRLALAGYALGLPLNALETWTVVQADFVPGLVWPVATYQLGRLAVTLGHVGLVLWLVRRGVLRRSLAALAATGRMALTNYLGQSAIAAVLFSGFGFGLYAELSRAPLFGVALAIWVAQVALSVWWLGRYRMGPMEWVWRGLTYGSWPPLRHLTAPS